MSQIPSAPHAAKREIVHILPPEIVSVPLPEVSHLITEDDAPVDNLFSEKQQRLLTEPLYSSWTGPGDNRKFLACANVGVFNITENPAIVPDVLLSLDVEAHPDIWAKEHRSYLIWEFGKPPDVVIEVVSNNIGGEQREKKSKYAFLRVVYYVVFDPNRLLSDDLLTIYYLNGLSYSRLDGLQLPDLKLGLTLWEGEFEGLRSTWLRWTDEQGNLILTGSERAAKLAAKLRALGHDPDAL